jgi:hypothetical protein
MLHSTEANKVIIIQPKPVLMIFGPLNLVIHHSQKAEEEAGLTKILSRSGDPKLAFGNDGDDMRSPGKGMDPRVNINDLSSDAIAYAEDRFKLVNNLMGKLVQKYSKPGQSYAEVRARYNTLNAQRKHGECSEPLCWRYLY